MTGWGGTRKKLLRGDNIVIYLTKGDMGNKNNLQIMNSKKKKKNLKEQEKMYPLIWWKLGKLQKQNSMGQYY